MASADLIDYDTMKTGSGVSYSFDITKLLDAANKGETSYANLVLKLLDENTSCSDKIVLYGSSYGGIYAPQLIVTYQTSYGVNISYRTHTHELGRFGQGSIDLSCGNLMLESEDFTWAGNRMPVTLKHLYNSALSSYQYTANSSIKLNTANFSSMKLGYGFKLNVMRAWYPLPSSMMERHTLAMYISVKTVMKPTLRRTQKPVPAKATVNATTFMRM